VTIRVQARHWRELIVPRADLVAAVGDRPLAGIWAAEALRVAAWRPRLGFETDHPYDRPRGRLAADRRAPAQGVLPGAGDRRPSSQPRSAATAPRLLHLDGSGHVLPDRGADLVLDGRSVGFVTSVARHHELGPIALALVKRNVAVDAPLLAGGIAAAQEVVVAP
jgi:hypothetical protein